MSARDHENAIRDLEPLNRLPRAAQGRLLAQAHLRSCAEGETVFRRGEVDPLCYFLLEGTVEFVLNGQVVKVVSAGEPVARRALDRAGAHSCTARAGTRATVLELDRESLERALAQSAAQAARDAGDWLSRLMASPLMGRLPGADVRALLGLLREQPVRAGEVVVRAGEAADHYHIVREGRCRCTGGRAPGQEPTELGPGEGFGEEAIVAGRPHDRTVTMLTDGRVMRLGREDFLEFAAEPLLRGATREQAEALERRGAVWLDLRAAEAHTQAALPGSVNVPAAQLPARLHALAPEERYIVCASDPDEARVGAFLLAVQGLDAVHLVQPIDELLPERAVPVPPTQPASPYGPGAAQPRATLAGESPEAVQAREALQERTAPPAFEWSSAQSQAAAASDIEAALRASLEAAVGGAPAQAPTEPAEADPRVAADSATPAGPAPDAIAALAQSIERQLRAALEEGLASLKRQYDQELQERTERLKQQAVQEVLRRDAEREANFRAACAEKENAIRQHYRKLMDLANRIGVQREELAAAREQLKQRIDQSGDLQREVHQMRAVLAQSLSRMDEVPTDKVLNRSIRTLLTG